MWLANRPTSDPFNMSFHPPAIQNAQAGHAIQCRLHSACSRGLERILRCVEPQIASGSKVSSQFHVVVIQKNDRNSLLQRFFRFKNALDNLFTTRVLRMSFSGIDNLEG